MYASVQTGLDSKRDNHPCGACATFFSRILAALPTNKSERANYV